MRNGGPEAPFFVPLLYVVCNVMVVGYVALSTVPRCHLHLYCISSRQIQSKHSVNLYDSVRFSRLIPTKLHSVMVMSEGDGLHNNTIYRCNHIWGILTRSFHHRRECTSKKVPSFSMALFLPSKMLARKNKTLLFYFLQ